MKNFLFLLLTLIGSALQAQSNEYLITGQVIEAASNQPIDYATIVVGSKSNGDIIAGTTTENGGLFELRCRSNDIYLEISFIGFKTKRLDELTWEGKALKLGTVLLGEDVETLDEVLVRADKSTTEFKLDKRVFNVGKDLSSTGASALEVLNNVPSVNVSIEGEVSLRGSTGVQILIDGKPSVLTDDQGGALGTITADMLEKVEVITNPSAKYDAEGTAGIINLVLKKDEKKGINGSVSLNVGIPENHSVGFSLNNRTKRFNLFTQLGVGIRDLPSDTENINRDLVSGTTVKSFGEEYRNETFYNLVLGTDYYINPKNVITLSGRFSYEVEDQPSMTNFTRTDKDGNVVQEWRREEVTEATNPKYQYELKYKRDFDGHKDHDLLFSAIGNYFGKDQSSTFENFVTTGTDNLNNQRTSTFFQEGKYTFKLDYTKPFLEKWTLETGAQYVANNVSNDFAVSNLINDEFIIDNGLTNVFDYIQNVLGVYGTGSYEGATWGVKVGLRLENTDLKTLLENTNDRNDRNFTNLFPSLHTSYKLSERVSLQAGYSKRIYRPRLWDLNPFFNIRNNFSVRTGNPDLLPEFTDSYEVGSIFIYDKVSFNVNAYHRYTTDVIERVSRFENNISVFTPENIGTRNTTGLEMNFKYSPVKKITLNGDVSYNIFKRVGTFNEQSFDFNADQWSTKLTSKFKLIKSFDFEITGQYRSSVRTVQGIRSGNLFADFGMRYKIFKGKGVLNVSVRDIFASRIRESIAEGTDFYAYSFRQRGRFITAGFSYGFGKGEAMQYGGGRRRH